MDAANTWMTKIRTAGTMVIRSIIGSLHRIVGSHKRTSRPQGRTIKRRLTGIESLEYRQTMAGDLQFIPQLDHVEIHGVCSGNESTVALDVNFLPPHTSNSDSRHPIDSIRPQLNSMNPQPDAGISQVFVIDGNYKSIDYQFQANQMLRILVADDLRKSNPELVRSLIVEMLVQTGAFHFNDGDRDSEIPSFETELISNSANPYRIEYTPLLASPSDSVDGVLVISPLSGINNTESSSYSQYQLEFRLPSNDNTIAPPNKDLETPPQESSPPVSDIGLIDDPSRAYQPILIGMFMGKSLLNDSRTFSNLSLLAGIATNSVWNATSLLAIETSDAFDELNLNQSNMRVGNLALHDPQSRATIEPEGTRPDKAEKSNRSFASEILEEFHPQVILVSAAILQSSTPLLASATFDCDRDEAKASIEPVDATASVPTKESANELPPITDPLDTFLLMEVVKELDRLVVEGDRIRESEIASLIDPPLNRLGKRNWDTTDHEFELHRSEASSGLYMGAVGKSYWHIAIAIGAGVLISAMKVRSRQSYEFGSRLTLLKTPKTPDCGSRGRLE